MSPTSRGSRTQAKTLLGADAVEGERQQRGGGEGRAEEGGGGRRRTEGWLARDGEERGVPRKPKLEPRGGQNRPGA